MRLRSLLWLMLLACAACTQEPSPTSPAEGVFNIDPGPGDRLFTVVSVTAGNGDHTLDGVLTAPYSLYVENASAPVQAIILPNTPASVADITLLFGGETVPRVVSNPSENSPGCPPTSDELCVNSGSAPTPVPPGTHEVRFDVVTTPLAIFGASVGGINETHIVQNAQAPSTIWVEGVTEIAQGVFNKANIATSLTVTLLIDGVAEMSDTSPAGSTDAAVVQAEIP